MNCIICRGAFRRRRSARCATEVQPPVGRTPQSWIPAGAVGAPQTGRVVRRNSCEISNPSTYAYESVPWHRCPILAPHSGSGFTLVPLRPPSGEQGSTLGSAPAGSCSESRARSYAACPGFGGLESSTFLGMKAWTKPETEFSDSRGNPGLSTDLGLNTPNCLLPRGYDVATKMQGTLTPHRRRRRSLPPPEV